MKRFRAFCLPAGSIRCKLQTSYFTIIISMTLPIVLLVLTMLFTNLQYNHLIANVARANKLCTIARTQLNNELWDIVSGKISFSRGRQYDYMQRLEEGLEDLAAMRINRDKMQYIIAAQRANDTMRGYIDQLHGQIQDGAAVSYNESLYEEIRSVAALMDSVLREYITEATVSISILNQRMQIVTFAVTIFIVFVVAAMIRFAHRSFQAVEQAIHTPILRLEQMTLHIAGGDLSVRAEAAELEELKQLTQNLNRMAGRLEELIAERIEVQQTVQKLEMRALQAQIAPHFVYNTFETIVWLAEQERNGEVINLTLAFTDFFRISLSKGQDYITVAREIQHVRSYLDIQSVRYGSIMRYDLQIDPALLNMRILKIVLQPLVENAIYHGIKRKRSRGKICITARANENETMTFSVADDGVGITAVRLAQIRQRLEGAAAPKDMGFGLFNVHKRLQLYYGAAGLCIESEYHKGTTIEFTLPCHLLE